MTTEADACEDSLLVCAFCQINRHGTQSVVLDSVHPDIVSSRREQAIDIKGTPFDTLNVGNTDDLVCDLRSHAVIVVHLEGPDRDDLSPVLVQSNPDKSFAIRREIQTCQS